MDMMRKLFGLTMACVLTLGLFGLVAYSLDGSAVRQALGIAPPLDVPYVETRRTMVDTMLDMAEVEEGDNVIDLGTGDGRILLAAAEDYGARGTGVDLDPTLVEEARGNAERRGVSGRVTFREEDLFDTPLGDADVVTMFLLPEVNLRLRPRLLEQLRPGTRIVSNRFDMGDWRPDETRRVGGYPAYLWIVPADIGGRWLLEWEGREIVLELEQAFQDVSGVATIDGERVPVTGEVRGEEVLLRIADGGPMLQGIAEGDRMRPADDATWRAVRQPR